MKSKTLLHYFDPPILAALTGLSLGLALLLHRFFLLLSLAFVLIWVGEAREYHRNQDLEPNES